MTQEPTRSGASLFDLAIAKAIRTEVESFTSLLEKELDPTLVSTLREEEPEESRRLGMLTEKLARATLRVAAIERQFSAG